MASSGTQGSALGHIAQRGYDYYDLDNILFTQSSVPVSVLTEVHGLGHLDPSGQDEEDLRVGAKLNLPLWLAEPMTRKKVTMVTMPKTHAPAIREALKMDPAAVSMAHNPYIYELGAVLTHLTNDPGLPHILSETFTKRFAQLFDNSRNWRDEDTSKATATMCNSEKKLFARGYESAMDYQRWAHHEQHGISAAPVVQAISRNRKRARPAD